MPELETILDFLRAEPVFTLFVVIGCGYLVGNIRIAGISLGAVTGTLLIGILLGRFDFRITPAAQSVGFAIFIFAVGYQAGPRFVEIAKSDGLRYLALAVVVVATGVATALVVGWLLDLPPGGTAAGSVLGLVSITVGGVPVGLGSASGLLAAGIVTGGLSSAKFPLAARWVLMEFGLLIFICGVGLQAGSGIVETLQRSGIELVLAAVVVVSMPVLAGYLFGRRVLRLPPVVLMGALTGAMTSGPALSLVTTEARSSSPVLGYSGTYAFASILLAISGTVVMLIA